MAEDGNWSADIANLGDQVANLTLAQAVRLSEYLDRVHGVKAYSHFELAPRPDPNLPPPEQAPVQTEFAVVLEGLADPTKKIQVIKVYRELSGAALKDAKDKVEGAPLTIKDGVSKAEAEKIKAQMEAAGAKITIK
jgi:large subunit ribosomal protein L7/L12